MPSEALPLQSEEDEKDIHKDPNGRKRRSAETIHFKHTGFDDVSKMTAIKFVLIKTDIGADMMIKEDIDEIRRELIRLLNREAEIKGLKEVVDKNDDDDVVEFARAYLKQKINSDPLNGNGK